jgi:hypothetical protein
MKAIASTPKLSTPKPQSMPNLSMPKPSIPNSSKTISQNLNKKTQIQSKNVSNTKTPVKINYTYNKIPIENFPRLWPFTTNFDPKYTSMLDLSSDKLKEKIRELEEKEQELEKALQDELDSEKENETYVSLPLLF